MGEDSGPPPESGVRCLAEPSGPPQASAIANDAERVHRKRFRAMSARSPDPRAATAATRKVEHVELEAMARYDKASNAWTPCAAIIRYTCALELGWGGVCPGFYP